MAEFRVSHADGADSRLVTRVRLRNYKSIAACDVRPAPLSFLVGPNGSGKSNLLQIDQLRPDPDRSSQPRLDLFETADAH